MRHYVIVGLLLVCLAVATGGCTAKSLAASDAFSYACAAGGECAVYMTLTNPGREDATLVGARSDIAARAELHRLTVDDEGMLAMQQVNTIPLPAADTVEFKPGSLHIMLYALSEDLKVGDTFDLTLLYERGEESTVEVLVMPEN